MLANQWVKPDLVSGCRTLGSQSQGQPVGGQGRFMTWLAVESGVSYSWCQPTGTWDQIPGQLGEGFKVSQSWY